MTEAELTAREYLRTIRDPFLVVGDARWDVWRESLSPAARDSLVDAAASRLRLPWPRSRKAEALDVYAGLALDDVLAQQGIGFQKARTILWAMGLAAHGGSFLELAKDVMRGPDAIVAPSPPPPSEEAASPSADEELDAAITELEDLDWDDDAVEQIVQLEEALATRAARTVRRGGRERLAEFVLARLGPSPMTLQEVGELADLSRERVRQVLSKSSKALRRDCSEVYARLVQLYSSWLAKGRESSDLKRLRNAIQIVFGKREASLHSPDHDLRSVTQAVVRRAYLDGDTPLAFQAVLDRVQQQIGVPPNPEAVLRACGGEGVVLVEVDGVDLVYADSTRDAIHRALMCSQRPLNHEELEAVTGFPRGTLYSLTGKDPRLIQQDDGTWVTFRTLPVREANGIHVIDGWQRDTSGDVFETLLSDVFADVTPRAALRKSVEIPLDELVQLAAQDLATCGVFNSTVWGFWHACAAVAEREFRADLPEAVSAIPLGQLATNRTDHVEIGGKRRVALTSHSSESERQDNAYWLQRAFCEMGGACTPTELSRRLEALFQNGPAYLHGLWMETYAKDAGYERFAPSPYPNLAVLVPRDWGAAGGELSFGVRRLARRLARPPDNRHRALSRRDFEGASWFADAIDVAAGGYPWKA